MRYAPTNLNARAEATGLEVAPRARRAVPLQTLADLEVGTDSSDLT
ncbi:MAG: hypothetical protein WBA11_02235 [Rubrivirga sp.]